MALQPPNDARTIVPAGKTPRLAPYTAPATLEEEQEEEEQDDEEQDEEEQDEEDLAQATSDLSFRILDLPPETLNRILEFYYASIEQWKPCIVDKQKSRATIQDALCPLHSNKTSAHLGFPSS